MDTNTQSGPATWTTATIELHYLGGLEVHIDAGLPQGHSLTRNVLLGRQLVLDLLGQFIGIVVMVSGALIWKSVWALVLGEFAATLFRVIWSHRLIPGYSNRFAFDRDAAKSMLRGDSHGEQSYR